MRIVIFYITFFLLFPASGADSIVPHHRAPFKGTPYQDIDDYFDFIGHKHPPWEIESYRHNPEDPHHTRDGFNNGKSTTTVGANDNAGRAIIFQTDGNILVAGRADVNFGIVRLVPSGHMDTTFNTTGRNATDFSGGQDVAHGIAIDPDGRAVLAGRVYGASDSDFGIARYTTAGVLDTSFNSNGKKQVNVNSSHDIARSVAVDASGRPVVGGYAFNGSVYTFAVLRLTSDGLLDTSFSTTGKTVTPANANDNGVLGVTLGTAGRIILVGNAHNGTNWDAAIAVYRSDGVLDTAFASSGKLVFSKGSGNETLYSAATDFSGRIAAVGSVRGGTDMDFLVVRLLSSGVFDTSFSSSGKLGLTLSGGDETTYSVKVQTNGGIVGAGAGYNGSNYDFALFRLLSSGTISGSSLTAVGSLDDFGMAVHMEDEGSFYVAGRTNNGSALDIAVVRYNAAAAVAKQGAVDLSFGTDGMKKVQPGGIILPSAVARDTSGRFLAGSEVQSNPGRVYRLTSNWVLDTTFGTIGSVGVSGTPSSFAFTSGANASILVSLNGTSMVAARFTTDGRLDTTFKTNGYAAAASSQVSGSEVAITSGAEQAIVVVRGDVSGMNVLRYTTDGRLDTTFGRTGTVNLYSGTTGTSARVFLGTNGDLFAYGVAGYDYRSLIIARYLTSGSLDTTFRTSGILKVRLGEKDTHLENMRVAEGKLQLFATRQDFGVGQLAILRLETSGAFDTSFYDRGWTAVGTLDGLSGSPTAVPLRGGRLDLGGCGSVYNMRAGVRLYDGGSLDTTFGTASVSFSGSISGAPLFLIEDTRGLVLNFGAKSSNYTYTLEIWRTYP